MGVITTGSHDHSDAASIIIALPKLDKQFTSPHILVYGGAHGAETTAAKAATSLS
ncbi:hypothetical protein [Actinomadura hibisca]|uniref:hypothetical protein n=1 Tax=Actinomadura hibisca TaxID=68565 RepID=UPI000A508132|nr:hypothetical protein [Actinomadura hibisca]